MMRHKNGMLMGLMIKLLSSSSMMVLDCFFFPDGFRLIFLNHHFFPYFLTEKVVESSPTNLKDSQASLIIPGVSI